MPTESHLSISAHGKTAATTQEEANSRTHRIARRRISPLAGRALEALGHAIEYLADEYALSSAQIGTLSSSDPRVEAIQLLMVLNRQVYYSCPEIEPLLQRIARKFIPTAWQANKPRRQTKTGPQLVPAYRSKE